MKIKWLCTAFIAVSTLNLHAQTGKITWDKTDYQGKPWVKNVSRPNEISEGLQNRHLSIWASHGRYYDSKKGTWKWQRPILFGTTELNLPLRLRDFTWRAVPAMKGFSPSL